MNHKYKVTCTAKNTANTAYGFVSKLFDTEEFADPVGIGVSPARGAPYQTIFSVHVMKPTNEALKCVFGYLNDDGEVLIEDLTGAGKRYSSQNQALQTKLPRPEDGSNMLHVFTRCYDYYGRHKTAEVTITMEGGDTVTFDLETKDRYVETIKK